MAEKDATLFTNFELNKYPAQAHERGGKSIFKRIRHVVVSGEASADTVRVAKILPGERVVAIALTNDGLGASVTMTVQCVDSASSPVTTTIVAAAAFATSTDRINFLTASGMMYTPGTGEATVKLLYGGAAPTVGKIIDGWIEVLPA